MTKPLSLLTTWGISTRHKSTVLSPNVLVWGLVYPIKSYKVPLDNNSFYSSSVWAAKYRTIKNANILLEAIANTTSIDAQDASGYRGFAQTVIAHQLLMLVKSYGRARVDVGDPTSPGPILQESEVLVILKESKVFLF